MDPVEQSTRGGASTEVRLRRALLAMAVLDEVDLTHRRDGVEVPEGGLLSWQDIAETLGPWVARPSHPVARARLLTLVTAVRLIGAGGPAGLAAAMRVHVEPPGSGLHPAAPWPVERLGTGPVVAGWGLLGVSGARCTRPLPPAPTVRAAVRSAVAMGRLEWRTRRADVDRLGGLLVQRLARDAAAGAAVVLRPMAETDVVTLLLSRTLRSFLAAADGSGMASLALPTRWRGWSDVRHVDPAFVRAAWTLTASLERAFGAPLLVTVDEVVLPRGVRDVLGTLGDDLGDHRVTADARRS